MRLLTEIEPRPAPLPDHIEIGVRNAQMRMEDARRMQSAAHWNSRSVRLSRHIEADPMLRGERTGALLAATERLACEQYAYARYLMRVDDYWLSIPHTTTKLRMDYQIEEALDANN